MEKERKGHNYLADAKEKLEDDKVKGILRFAFEIVLTLVIAALTAVVMFQSVTMQESSMEPTISVGDRFFMNRAVYKFRDPGRGDIIVFKTNGADDAALHIRRVVGIPGDTIQIIDGRVVVNGGTLKEKGDFPLISNPGSAATPVTLESGEYFVLGDNRNNSEDSRYGDIGKVKQKYIVGKLWFTISPARKLGFLKN